MRYSFWSMLVAVALMLTLGASPASACSIITRDVGPSEARKFARDAVSSATAIIDGEVVRPFIRGEQNALVRAVRVLKGSPQVEFEVGERDSCDIALERVGERSRMLLVGGPSLYFLEQSQADTRYVDKVLRSDRRKLWPYQSGKSQ